jgi:hypothetical protein
MAGRHLVKWFKQYAEKGLVVIDINHGGDPKEVYARSLEEDGIIYPTLWDEHNETFSKAYGVIGKPFGCLIGVDGTVIWAGVPTGLEEMIVEELQKVDPEILKKVREGEPKTDDDDK